MNQPAAPEPSWTDHFIEQGYAVLRGLIDPDYCSQALARVRQIVNNDRPLNQWTTREQPVLHQAFYQGGTAPDPVLDRLFDQPRLRQAINDLFGQPDRCNWERNYYLFLRPFNPEGKPALSPTGHIDFGSQPVPILYRGFTFQLSLVETQPFSGNITIFPGTHKTVQKLLLDDPDRQFRSGLVDIHHPAPFEFVARPGDVLFMHHLVLHSGNDSHAANRAPRIAIHGEAFSDHWPDAIAPASSNLGPWERSLCCNGPCRENPRARDHNLQKRREYIADLARKRAASATA